MRSCDERHGTGVPLKSKRTACVLFMESYCWMESLFSGSEGMKSQTNTETGLTVWGRGGVQEELSALCFRSLYRVQTWGHLTRASSPPTLSFAYTKKDSAVEVETNSCGKLMFWG